jgi:3-hydroxyisobutyrate dehydrogenase
MGSGMARRLLGAGFSVSVYNRNPEKSAAFAKEGAKVAATPAAAAEGANVIVSMVADDSAARAVWLGSEGAAATAARGAIFVESSTVSVAWVRELATVAVAKACEFLDAPVTGSRAQASAGELNFLVGGAASTLEKARPVLAAMSRSIVPLGPVGSGAMVKLVNNFVCGVQVAAIAEAIAMIERSGLDRTRALEVLVNGAPGSPLVKTVAGRMTAPDYTPNFLVRLMGKDLAYATQEAGKQSLELTTAAAALGVFNRAAAAGHAEKDIAAVVEPLRRH